jgi:hypothetical protein
MIRRSGGRVEDDQEGQREPNSQVFAPESRPGPYSCPTRSIGPARWFKWRKKSFRHLEEGANGRSAATLMKRPRDHTLGDQALRDQASGQSFFSKGSESGNAVSHSKPRRSSVARGPEAVLATNRGGRSPRVREKKVLSCSRGAGVETILPRKPMDFVCPAGRGHFHGVGRQRPCKGLLVR